MGAIGTPTVALGITSRQYFPLMGLVNGLLYAGALISISIIVLLSDLNIGIKTGHSVLIFTMVLAIYYAVRVAFEISTINISTMVLTHGIGNGLIVVSILVLVWEFELTMP